MGAPGWRGRWRAYRGAVRPRPGLHRVFVTAAAVPAPTDGERRRAERLTENGEGGAGTERRREERA
jgi:hypothetical protein